MNTVYALIVGIDAYRAVTPLRGCRNDAAEMLGTLHARTRGVKHLAALELYDQKATRAAVIDGLRDHLTLAGPDDTALFYFAGHGSTAGLPPELWHLESTGRTQTLVCADSRHDGVPDLWDKELSVLLDRVAASGCHVVVVLDSCHSEGATRGADRRVRTRSVPPGPTPRAEDLLPLTDLPPVSRHVTLAACRSDEYAQEMPDPTGTPRGVFTVALLRAMAERGPEATTRELLTAARCTVEDLVFHQRPQLSGDVGRADRPLLGGRTGTAPGIVLRHSRGEWEIDAGRCHGLPPGGGEVRVAVSGAVPVRQARVTSVLAERSLVEPIGWSPDPGRQYPMVVTRVPRPRATARIWYAPEAADTALAIIARLDASPHVRPADPLGPVRADLVIRVPEPGRAEVRMPDGDRLAGDLTGSPADCARRTVATCEHIARWREVKALGNPRSSIAGAVRLEIVAARPGERTAPLDRPALRPDDDGVLELTYPTPDRPPTVFVRLRNTGDRPLYCVLLDLTDSYRIHAGLFRGAFVAPGHSGAALEGRPVQLSLPSGTETTPGASVRDWFKLIVAEEQFSSRPYELGPLDGRAPAAERDAGAALTETACDWTTALVRIRTSVHG